MRRWQDGAMRLAVFRSPPTLSGSSRSVGIVTRTDPLTILDIRKTYLDRLGYISAGRVPMEGHVEHVAKDRAYSSLEHFILRGSQSLEVAAAALEQLDKIGDGEALRGGLLLENPTLLAPFTKPNSLRDFIAFEDHAKAGAARRGETLNPQWYERPLYYKGNHRSLLGPGDDVPRPAFTSELDFEMEVACIIDKVVRDADERASEAAIFGYTILNDWSARDVQRIEMASRLGPAKSKDFATSIGPWVVTADEVPSPPSLKMQARVNGRVIVDANLADAYWTFPKLIAFVSQGETVWPNDIYGSGTPYKGCMLDNGGPYLDPGDVVELEVEKLGTLTNTVTG